MTLLSTGQSEQTQYVEILGKPFRCLACRHNKFHRKQLPLRPQAAMGVNLDMQKEAVECYVCESCGHVHWFAPS